MKLIERIEELSKTLPRPSYSEADTKGKSLVIRWMLEDGLTVNKDIYGNIEEFFPVLVLLLLLVLIQIL